MKKLQIAALVPVKNFSNSKSRLSGILSQKGREILSELMLKSTLHNLNKINFISEIIVVSEDSKAKKISSFFGANFLYAKETGVNHAIKVGDEFCKKNEINCNIVIPIDLALLVPSDLFLLFSISSKYHKCSIICPSARKDGTNFLLRRPIDIFETSYDHDSYYNHILLSRKAHVHTIVFSSMSLMLDLDTTDDITKLINLFPKHKLSRLLLAANWGLI